MRMVWLGLLVALLGGCKKDEQGRAPEAKRLQRGRDAGFAVTGHGAGARAGVLAGPPIDAAVDAALGMLAIPECGAFLRMIDHCMPQMEPTVADSFRQARVQILQAWSSVAVTPEMISAVVPACKQASDSMRESMKTLGCVLPP
ncbi:MAG: hypothetical protein IT370_33115 [Deltaproteobacteria bacterium]|nr:hypothetical protein [Deltaproteobacteria bacterium]